MIIDFLMNNLFFFQLIGMTSSGGILGELMRLQKIDPPPLFVLGRFLPRVLSSIFLASLLGYILVIVTERENISIISAGIASYQDEEKIMEILKGILIDTMEAALRKLKGGGKE